MAVLELREKPIVFASGSFFYLLSFLHSSPLRISLTLVEEEITLQRREKGGGYKLEGSIERERERMEGTSSQDEPLISTQPAADSLGSELLEDDPDSIFHPFETGEVPFNAAAAAAAAASVSALTAGVTSPPSRSKYPPRHKNPKRESQEVDGEETAGRVAADGDFHGHGKHEDLLVRSFFISQSWNGWSGILTSSPLVSSTEMAPRGPRPH